MKQRYYQVSIHNGLTSYGNYDTLEEAIKKFKSIQDETKEIILVTKEIIKINGMGD